MCVFESAAPSIRDQSQAKNGDAQEDGFLHTAPSLNMIMQISGEKISHYHGVALLSCVIYSDYLSFF